MHADQATSFSTSFITDRTPQQAYDAINDVRDWWTGEIIGPTSELGGEFTYRVPGIHSSTHRVTEQVPGERVVWLTTDASLTFIADPSEWVGTSIVFDIDEVDGSTRVRFTHEGLTPACDCFEACSPAWTGYVAGLARLVDSRELASVDRRRFPRSTGETAAEEAKL